MTLSLEPRGLIMRRELEDIISRMNAADETSLFNTLRNIKRAIGPVRQKYMNASDDGRKAILKVLKKFARESWQKQDWPAALGLSVVALNVEINFVHGPDSAYVKAQTAALILRAAAIR